MRLIDADALYEEIYELRYTKESPSIIFTAAGQEIFNSGVESACYVVAQSNTIDAVPVVRCKDCVHSASLEGFAKRKFEIGLNCTACRGDNGFGIANLSFTVPDGYCDDGLRRSDEVND